LSRAACPFCRTPHTSFSEIGSEPSASDHPEDGDVAVCGRCGCAAVWSAAGGGLRKPTPDEAAVLVRDPQVAAAKARIIAASRDPQTGWELPDV
jgi:hypothetical protein